jgi:HEAT repeat protein
MERNEDHLRRIQRLKREGDVAALVAELDNPAHLGPGGLKAWVVRALGKLRNPEAVGPLVALVREDSDEIVASTAARALGDIGHPSAIPALVTAAKERPDLVKAWAADSLGRLRASEAAPLLVGLLDSQSPLVRRAAAQALGHVGDRSVAPALSRAAGRDAWWQRGVYRRSIRRLRSSA